MEEIRYSVCPHDCPDTCAWQVKLVDGKIVQVTGDPVHPVTKGVICAKARCYPERVYGEDRVLYPMRRTGPKGSKEFTRISWNEALTEITDRWQVLIAQYGPECILPYSYAGTEGIVNNGGMGFRFFNRLGATRLQRTICSAAGAEGYNHVYGGGKGVNPAESNWAKLILLWGINALETNLHQAMFAAEARRTGAKIVVIDVHRNKTAAWADEFYHILPGADGALALGLAHVIVRDGLADREWLNRYATGIDEFEAAIRDYAPGKVAAITGLSAAQIEELAHQYATTRPSLIRIGNGFQHHDNGGMSTWAIACLPALVGAWRDRGGGAIKFNSGHLPVNSASVVRPDLVQGTPRTVNMNQLGRALTELNPPVYSMYVFNSNPAVVAPQQTLVRQGLMREDLFTVVHEQVWTDTALLADIVLPATTHLEHADLYRSYWHCYWQWAEPVIPPQGESKPNIEVFAALAERMGFDEPCFGDSAEDIARQALDLPVWHRQGVSLERLKHERFIAAQVPEIPFAKGGFPTSSGLAQLCNEKAADWGLPTVPGHYPLVEGPETAGADYPLTLISPPNHEFLNSTFANIPALRTRAAEPSLEIHPLDAAKREIGSGDLVAVFNRRGKCRLRALVTENVLPGVVVAAGLFWLGPDGDGINALTPDRLGDMGEGAVFFSNLVEVQKIS